MIRILRSRLSLVLLGLALVGTGGAPLHGQGPITEELADSIGMKVVPLTIEATLYDATTAYQQRHDSGNRQAPLRQIPIANAQVIVYAVGSSGDREKIEGTVDAAGRCRLDLGLRFVGTEVQVYAMIPTAFFASMPFNVGANPPSRIEMFRMSRDPRLLVQEMMRVVTEKPGPDGEPAVHVRQVVFLSNRSFYTFNDHESGGYVFPVPPGATMISLQVNRSDVLDKEPQAVGGTWGHGVPIKQLIFPTTNANSGARPLSIIGTFTLPKSDAPIDLGGAVNVDTVRYSLAIEQNRFRYLEAQQGGTLLRGGETVNNLPGVKQSMVHYSAPNLTAGTRVAGWVTQGRPPIQPIVLMITSLLLLVPLCLVFFGYLLGRSGTEIASNRLGDVSVMSSEDLLHRLEALDLRLARGEISDEEYDRSRGAIRSLASEVVRRG